MITGMRKRVFRQTVNIETLSKDNQVNIFFLICHENLHQNHFYNIIARNQSKKPF